jgi:hypothetical protein
MGVVSGLKGVNLQDTLNVSDGESIDTNVFVVMSIEDLDYKYELPHFDRRPAS